MSASSLSLGNNKQAISRCFATFLVHASCCCVVSIGFLSSSREQGYCYKWLAIFLQFLLIKPVNLLCACVARDNITDCLLFRMSSLFLLVPLIFLLNNIFGHCLCDWNDRLHLYVPCQVDGVIKVLVFLLFLCNIYYYNHDCFLFQEAAILQDCINLCIFMVFHTQWKMRRQLKISHTVRPGRTDQELGQRENILVLVK